jgi:two-component system, NtrC family, nitrogen regulation sensor histidine kinase NtrY
MTARFRRSQLWMALSGSVTVLLLAAVSTLGSLNLPFEPQGSNELVILYALNVFIVAALLVFGLILARSLLRVWAERRARQLGSRFKTKMVVGAMAVSLLPLIFMFFISYALMNRTLNRWFPRSLEVAYAETDALLREINLGEYVRLAEIAKRAVQTEAAQQSAPQSTNVDAAFDKAAQSAAEQGAEGVWALDAKGNIQAAQGPITPSFVLDPTLKFARTLPGGAELWQTRTGFVLAARAPLASGFLVVAHRLPVDFMQRYGASQSQALAYVVEQQGIRSFKRQILLTLSLFTILLLFSATWFALFLSKEVTVPIQALAEATHEIAAGRFDTRVKVKAQDELGTLVRSFNAMTAQLADSRKQIDEFTQHLQQAVQELDRRRVLIETVLENIPTGVLSLDPAGKLLRINTAAREIFGERSREAGEISDLVGNEVSHDIQHLIRRSLRMGTAWKELEIRLGGRLIHAAVTVSPLGPRRSNAGYVIVVDDLTELLRAQKAAAWQEVAQRIAHEIRNPLTPIQLSAERLARYITRNGDKAGAPEFISLVSECAALIGREVGTLEGLVNQFSQFARFPVARFTSTDPNAVVRDALEVFKGRLDDVRISTDLAADLPPVKADPELLRRVVVNLIDNAAEAMEDSSAKQLQLSTRLHAGHETVEIAVSDSGQGISPEDKDKLFLPYFSTKERGTGLGLAIASRIIAEHNGLIRVEDNLPAGARFVIELPLAEPVHAILTPETLS